MSKEAGMAQLIEQAYEQGRTAGRLEALREVRKIAITMDRDPDNDPYLWGYGGSKITAMLTQHVQAARNDVEGDRS